MSAAQGSANAMAQRSHLNAEQQQAVEHQGSPLAVLAGPGTGKTRVITHRIARLIENGADPDRIVALTFTVKAGQEMRSRLAELVGPSKADRVQAGTFHGWGGRAVARFADVLGIPATQTLADSAQRSLVLHDAVVASIDAGEVSSPSIAEGAESFAAQCQSWIERCRVQGLTPVGADESVRAWNDLIQTRGPVGDWDDLRVEAETERLRRFADAVRVYHHLERLRTERRLSEHDDAILLPIKLLKEHAGPAAILRDEARYVVVDEFQDVNPAQLSLLEALCPPKTNPDLCVVGDDDQAIYAFRGADEIAFARFEAMWTGSTRVLLTDNHRSSASILTAAGDSIARANRRQAADKAIIARRTSFEPSAPEHVLAVHLDNDGDAGPTISAMVRDQLAQEPSVGPENIAVIARSHTDLDRIALALEQDGVPVQRARSRRAIEDQAVQDLHAWLELLSNASAVYSAVRLLVRPPYSVPATDAVAWRAGRTSVDLESLSELGDDGARFAQDLEKLREAAATQRVDELAWAIVRETGLSQHELLSEHDHGVRSRSLSAAIAFVIDKAARLPEPADVNAYMEHYNRLDAAEQGYSLRDEQDDERIDERQPGVRLITAHGSKGLEFDTVFVPRVDPVHGYGSSRTGDDTELPRSITDPGHLDDRDDKARRIDEERRLFYVACTRAERRLVILAKQRKKPSSSTHFFQELAWPGSPSAYPDGPVLLEHASDAIDRAEASGVIVAPVEPIDAHATSIDEAHRIEREARRGAARALDAAAADPSLLDDAIQQLSRSAARVAAAAAIARGDDVPEAVSVQAGEDFVASTQDRLRAPELAHQLSTGPLTLSYSQIDAYRRCPRCYQLTHIFGLREPDSQVQSVGIAVHAGLRSFYQQWADADAEGSPKPGLADLLTIAEAQLAPEAPSEIRAQLRAQLESLWHNLHSDDDHIVELERRVAFPFELDGVTHTMVSVIDRVDQTSDGAWRIVDYKTGKAWDKLEKPKADDLQLGMYAMALPHAMGLDEADTETLAGVAEFWLLAAGTRGTLGFDRMKLDKVRTVIAETIEGISAGRFDPKPHCKGPCSVLG